MTIIRKQAFFNRHDPPRRFSGSLFSFPSL